VIAEYVGQAFVIEPDGDEAEVRALLRIEADGWCGGSLIGAVDWLGIAENPEPFLELRLPDGRIGAAFVSEFDTVATDQRVTIAGMGTPPFGQFSLAVSRRLMQRRWFVYLGAMGKGGRVSQFVVAAAGAATLTLSSTAAAGLSQRSAGGHARSDPIRDAVCTVAKTINGLKGVSVAKALASSDKDSWFNAIGIVLFATDHLYCGLTQSQAHKKLVNNIQQDPKPYQEAIDKIPTTLPITTHYYVSAPWIPLGPGVPDQYGNVPVYWYQYGLVDELRIDVYQNGAYLGDLLTSPGIGSTLRYQNVRIPSGYRYQFCLQLVNPAGGRACSGIYTI
jgi:hypothetical protein